MKSYEDYITSSPMTDGEEIRDFLDTCSKTETPCDYPDSDGHYHCPYDAQGGDDCRRYCGLGVDE